MTKKADEEEKQFHEHDPNAEESPVIAYVTFRSMEGVLRTMT